jgi:hypothetical protein
MCDQLHVPVALFPSEKAAGVNLKGGWVDLRIGLEDVERVEIFPVPGLELGFSAILAIVSPCID